MGNQTAVPFHHVEIDWKKIAASSSSDQPGAPVPPEREGHSAVCLDGKLYIFGGGASGGTQRADLWCLDVEAGKWSQVATSGHAPSARTGACAAAVDGRLFVFGGMDMEQGFLDDFYAFDVATSTWEKVQSVGEGPTPRDKSALCVVDKKLYLFGGFGPQITDSEGEEDDEEGSHSGPAMSFGWFSDLFTFNPNTNEWQEVEASGQLPSPRAAFGMDAVGTSIFVFGGRDTEKRQNDLYVLDTRSGEWSKPTVSGIVPVERSFHTFTSLASAGQEQLVLVGGLSSLNMLLDDVHVFDVAASAWVSPSVKPSGKITPRRFHSATLHNKSLVVFGGSSNYSLETQECETFHNDTYGIDLTPILEAPPVVVPTLSSSSTSAPSVSFISPSTTESTEEGDPRGRKRKSEEIAEEEPANNAEGHHPAGPDSNNKEHATGE